ncbi:MAG: glycosyltransferase 87 family protein, partial [Armatimonadota bacterium]
MNVLKRETAVGERGAWLSVLVGAFGWMLSALVLARGGGYFEIVPHLAFVLPVAVVGTVTALASFGVCRRGVTPVAWLGVVVAFGLAWNFLVYWLRFGVGTWGLLIPLAKPTGFDFLYGLYEPARAFTTIHSGWPPLTLILGKPFTLFAFSTAHIVQVVVLTVLAVASVFLSALLSAKAMQAGDRLPARRHDVLSLGLVAGLWLFTSAGFMYQMERANIDMYVLFSALLAVWLMLRLSHSPWWPALALAISINLKVYPCALLVLLFWRYRWKAIVPALATNTALLMVAGPRNVVDSLSGRLAWEASTRAYWWAITLPRPSRTSCARPPSGHRRG